MNSYEGGLAIPVRGRGFSFVSDSLVAVHDESGRTLWDLRQALQPFARREGGTEDADLRALRLTDKALGEALRSKLGPDVVPGDTQAVALNNAGSLAAVVRNDRTIAVFDLASGEEEGSWRCPIDFVAELVLSEDGRAVVIRGGGDELLWSSGGATRSLDNDGSPLALSPDGTLLVLGGVDGEVVFMDVGTARVLAIMGLAGGVLDACFSPSGSRVALISATLAKVVPVEPLYWEPGGALTLLEARTNTRLAGFEIRSTVDSLVEELPKSGRSSLARSAEAAWRIVEGLAAQARGERAKGDCTSASRLGREALRRIGIFEDLFEGSRTTVRDRIWVNSLIAGCAEPAHSIELYQSSLDLLEDLRPTSEEVLRVDMDRSWLLMRLGDSATENGDVVASSAHLEAALQIAESVHESAQTELSFDRLRYALTALLWHYQETGSTERIFELQERRVEVYREEAGRSEEPWKPRTLASCMRQLAALHEQRGDLVQAAIGWRDAAGAIATIEDKKWYDAGDQLYYALRAGGLFQRLGRSSRRGRPTSKRSRASAE